MKKIGDIVVAGTNSVVDGILNNITSKFGVDGIQDIPAILLKEPLNQVRGCVDESLGKVDALADEALKKVNNMLRSLARGVLSIMGIVSTIVGIVLASAGVGACLSSGIAAVVAGVIVLVSSIVWHYVEKNKESRHCVVQEQAVQNQVLIHKNDTETIDQLQQVPMFQHIDYCPPSPARKQRYPQKAFTGDAEKVENKNLLSPVAQQQPGIPPNISNSNYSLFTPTNAVTENQNKLESITPVSTDDGIDKAENARNKDQPSPVVQQEPDVLPEVSSVDSLDIPQSHDDTTIDSGQLERGPIEQSAKNGIISTVAKGAKRGLARAVKYVKLGVKLFSASDKGSDATVNKQRQDPPIELSQNENSDYF